jgi:hypothetical protein
VDNGRWGRRLGRRLGALFLNQRSKIGFMEILIREIKYFVYDKDYL